MTRRRSKEYPRVVYGPYGASKVVTRVEDWPSGWTTQPQGDETSPPRPPVRVDQTRGEIKVELRARNIAFGETSATAELWRLLNG